MKHEKDIRKELQNTGLNISEYRNARILKKNGLAAKSGTHYPSVDIEAEIHRINERKEMMKKARSRRNSDC